MTRSGLCTAVLWLLIITIVAMSQVAINRNNNDIQHDDAALDLQIQISAKYFVGIKQLAGQNPLLQKRVSELAKEIQDYQIYKKQLSTIPVFAEFFGRGAALQEIKRMMNDPDGAPDPRDLQIFYRLYHDGSGSLDSEQIITLKGYGWAGRLALSQDKPDSDPERAKALKSATRTVLLSGLGTIVLIAALVTGLILLIIALTRMIKKDIHSQLVIQDASGILLLETFTIYLILTMAMPLLITLIAPDLQDGTILMTILAGLISILWPSLRGTGWEDYRTAFGWNRGKGLFREIGAGVVGFIAGLPLLGAAFIIVMILVKYAGNTPSHPAVTDLIHSPFFLFFLACIYAPLVEETLFRGALYYYLRRHLPWAASGILCGLIFGALHPQGWVALPAITAIGFNLSVIREWRGSVIASITAHALNNGVVTLMLVIAVS